MVKKIKIGRAIGLIQKAHAKRKTADIYFHILPREGLKDKARSALGRVFAGLVA